MLFGGSDAQLLRYDLGKIVVPNGWDTDCNKRCAQGIHVFSHRNSIPLLIDDIKNGGKSLIFEALNELIAFNTNATESVVDEDTVNCVICSKNIQSRDNDDDIMELSTCHHRFHANCISKWLSKHTTCPLCKTCVDLVSNVKFQLSDRIGTLSHNPIQKLGEVTKYRENDPNIIKSTQYEGRLHTSDIVASPSLALSKCTSPTTTMSPRSMSPNLSVSSEHHVDIVPSKNNKNTKTCIIS